MKISRAIFVFSLLVCCLVLPSGSVLGAAPKKPVPPPDYRKLVKSVDAKANSISILNSRTKEVHIYRIDDLTVVKIDGVPAKFAAIKAGMEVSDSTERDADDLDAVSLLSKTHAPVAVDPKTAAAAAAAGPIKTIQSVIPDKSQVVIFYSGSKLARTYRIDANTQLKVNGVSGAIGDIKAGMVVKDYMERDNDDLDSLTVMGY